MSDNYSCRGYYYERLNNPILHIFNTTKYSEMECAIKAILVFIDDYKKVVHKGFGIYEVENNYDKVIHEFKIFIIKKTEIQCELLKTRKIK